MILSLTYVVIATLIHLVLVLLAGQAHDWLQRGRHAHIVRRGFAFMLAGVALWFLWSSTA